jgi:hypothetical protein
MVYHNQQQSALINLLNADLFRVIFLTPLGKLVLRQVCRLFFDMWPGLLAELKHRSLRVDVYERSTTEIAHGLINLNEGLPLSISIVPSVGIKILVPRFTPRGAAEVCDVRIFFSGAKYVSRHFDGTRNYAFRHCEVGIGPEQKRCPAVGNVFFSYHKRQPTSTTAVTVVIDNLGSLPPVERAWLLPLHVRHVDFTFDGFAVYSQVAKASIRDAQPRFKPLYPYDHHPATPAALALQVFEQCLRRDAPQRGGHHYITEPRAGHCPEKKRNAIGS